MSISKENRELIERCSGRSWITARSMLVCEVGIEAMLDAAREAGREDALYEASLLAQREAQDR